MKKNQKDSQSLKIPVSICHQENRQTQSFLHGVFFCIVGRINMFLSSNCILSPTQVVLCQLEPMIYNTFLGTFLHKCKNALIWPHLSL